jgi:hypothetical protein
VIIDRDDYENRNRLDNRSRMPRNVRLRIRKNNREWNMDGKERQRGTEHKFTN